MAICKVLEPRTLVESAEVCDCSNSLRETLNSKTQAASAAMITKSSPLST